MKKQYERSESCHLVLVGLRATLGPWPSTPFQEKVFEKQREDEGEEEIRAYPCSHRRFPAESPHVSN